MVGLDLNPPWVEGIRNTVREVSKQLIDRGHEVYILTKGYGNQPKEELIDGIKYHRIIIGKLENDSKDYLAGTVQFFFHLPFEMRKVVRNERIDIIHGHSVYPIFGAYYGMLTKNVPAKLVYTLYSSPKSRNSNSSYPAIMKVLDISKSKSVVKMLSHCMDAITVTSRTTESELKQIGVPTSKMRTIFIGINRNVFKPDNTKTENLRQLKIDPSKQIILFAGDITPWKGIDIFLQAFAEVNRQNDNTLAILMTKNIYKYESKRRAEIEKLIDKLEIGEEIYFIGQHEKIQDIYNVADIVVFPYVTLFSVMDIPLSLLEAMSVKKPVVVTDVGAMGEALENDSGLLIQPANSLELSKALNYLLANKTAREALSENAYNKVAQQFDVEQTARELETLYYELLR